MSKAVLFCFGFTTNSPPDVVRMRSVLQLFSDRITECVPVAQSTPPTTEFPEVVQGNFASLRFFRSGSALHCALTGCAARNLQAIAILDYFWLQAHAYRTHYGGSWGSKIDRLFDMGFDEVYLPVDYGTLNRHAIYIRAFLTSWANVRVPGVRWEYVPASSVPLYVASATDSVQEILDAHHRGSNETQGSSYLHADAAQRTFVRFHRSPF